MRKVRMNVLEFVHNFCGEIDCYEIQLFDESTGENILFPKVAYGKLKNMEVLSVIEPCETKLHLRVCNSETVSEWF